MTGWTRYRRIQYPDSVYLASRVALERRIVENFGIDAWVQELGINV
jgi:hypothetical protein